MVAFAHYPRETPTEHLVATSVVLEKAPPPTPTRPTAKPKPVRTPPPKPVVRATLAPVERAAPSAARHTGGTSAAPVPVPHPLRPHVVARPKPAAAAGVAFAPGNGAGAGTGTGAGGDAGEGAGNGAGGSGTGEVNADAPCGYVDLIPDEARKMVGDTAYETIRATVHYPDGHTQSDTFPYPWVYANYETTDPWSSENMRKANAVAYAQLPPPGTDTRRYSDVIRYVLDHTDVRGHTVLQPCPR